MDQKHIRNFAIIAHVDHGKSTLADRMLEITRTIAKEKLLEQFLDQNPISRERGITIKLAPVRMKWVLGNQEYVFNLIDTPGHIDFSYEVSRTLAACEGVILLVDATQGIQAQTVAHYRTAKKLGLLMIPVINKIDLPNAQVEQTKKEIVDLTGCLESDILYISAKTGEGVEKVLDTVVEKISSPKGSFDLPLRALIFDAVYDEYRGVVTYTRVVDGSVKKGDKIQLPQSGVRAEVTEVGTFSPYLQKADTLTAGEIGYIITGIKDIRQCRVGDTIMLANQPVVPLPGYQIPKSMVFLGLYPKNTNELRSLKEALLKLTLNDTALTYSEEYSAYLGSGYRVGFLGLLHAEIVKERLSQEFGLDLLFTMPQVLYQFEGEEMLEPYISLTIYAPSEYVGGIMTVCQKRKGNLLNMTYHESYAILEYDMPYSMFIRGVSAELKSISSGFASIDYEQSGYKKADMVKLEVRINDNPIDVLSEYVYREEAVSKAREKALKLKDSLDRQQFRQVIQGVVNGNIVAREEISPFRKDVLQKMSGGDRTRKDKLLEAQKKGKSRMVHSGKVNLSQEALFSMIESR